MIYAYGWNFVARSWRIYEASPNPGGLRGYFILKSFILVFAAVIALQGVAMALRSVLVLAGREELLPERLRYETQEPA